MDLLSEEALEGFTIRIISIMDRKVRLRSVMVVCELDLVEPRNSV